MLDQTVINSILLKVIIQIIIISISVGPNQILKGILCCQDNDKFCKRTESVKDIVKEDEYNAERSTAFVI